MKTFTQEEARRAYEYLPPDRQEFVFSPDVAERMYSIGTKNGFVLPDIGKISEQVGLLVLGLIREDELIPQLQGTLGIDYEKARDIAIDVRKMVLTPYGITYWIPDGHNGPVGIEQGDVYEMPTARVVHQARPLHIEQSGTTKQASEDKCPDEAVHAFIGILIFIALFFFLMHACGH